MVVPDLAANVETLGFNRLRKLRLLAICALSIAAVMAPPLIARLTNANGMGVLTFGLLRLSIDLPMLLIVVLFSRTQMVGDLEIVWWRRRRSEVRWVILLVFTVVLGLGLARWCMRHLGLPLSSGFGVRGEQVSIAFVVAYAVHSAILTPVLEEVFWRGYVQRTLERIAGGFSALVGQTVLFATMHIPAGGFSDVLVLGLILGVWRWRRRTLLPVILAHMFVNTLYCAVHLEDWIDVSRVRAAVNYVPRMNELSKPPDYDLANDACQDYERAVQLAVLIPDEVDKVRKRYPTDWAQDAREATRKWVGANARALEYLAQGTEKPYYWPICAGKDATTASLPPLASARRLALALSARIKLEAYDAKEEPLVSDFVILYRFGSHFGGRKTLIHQLVSKGIHELAIHTLRGILAHESLSPQTLRELQRQLESFEEDRDFTMDFSLEHLVWLDNVQTTFTDEGNGRGHIPKATVWDEPNDAEEGYPPDPRSYVKKEELLKLDRRETIRFIEEFFEDIQIAGRKTPWQLHNEPNSVSGILSGLLERNAFLRIWGQPCFRSMELPWRARVDLQALVATLGAIRYRADQGQYPDSLEQLVETGYLKHVPQDCYSNGSLIYKRTEDDFLLYSCGADFDDDGGTPSKWGEGKEGGDQVFWPVSEKD